MTKPQLHSLKFAVATLVAMLGCTCARADDPMYYNSVRLGLYSLFYNTSADDLSGPFVPAGTNLAAENVVTLYAAYVRSLSTRFDVELTAGYPPLVKVKGVGPSMLGSVPYNGQVISTARWIAPSVLVQYKFLSENSPLRPYIGVGATYVTFYDRNNTAAGNAAAGGPTKLSLTSSLGPSATAGLRWHIGGHWNLYGSYSVSQVKTDLTADTLGIIRTTHISFGPQALVIAAGFSF
jgi:outer membrane protein